MTFIHQAVAETARLAIRQAAETTATLSSAATGLSPSPSSAVDSSPTAITLTSLAPSPTESSTLANGNPGNGGNGGNGNSSNNSSSLLFFVALGFGVVFTNLW